MRRSTWWLLPVLLLAGCGGEPAVPDRAAFDQAVAAYLDSHHMDLKIERYKSFKLEGDGNAAEAEIAMGYAGEGIKATSRFIFHFQKTGAGWQVSAHEQK